MKETMNPRLPRRAFLAGAATATVLTALKPSLIFGAEANSVRKSCLAFSKTLRKAGSILSSGGYSNFKKSTYS